MVISNLMWSTYLGFCVPSGKIGYWTIEFECKYCSSIRYTMCKEKS